MEPNRIHSPRAAARKLVLLPHQEIEFRAQQSHDLILSIGGVGSGKTTSFVLWLLDRMQWDTSQMAALFALTTVQLRAVMRVIYKQIEKLGIERTFNCRPPKHWRDEWERKGIRTPVTQDRYENVVIWRTGLHLQLGTLTNRAYEQHRGAEWGSLGVEEFTLQGVTQEAIDFLFERTRCGDSDAGYDCTKELGHRHTKILHGNPPESPDHWVWTMLQNLEDTAADEAKRNGKHIDGVTDGYPHLCRGIGSAILIPSRSTDNASHLPKGYIENQMARLDSETAARRLGGALTRTKVGRAYSDFDKQNEHPVGYDEGRMLYVALDFNNRPVAATLHHPLNPGEYPSEHDRPGIKHFGQFGEIFDTTGGGLQALCALLLSGDPGNMGHVPRNWRGLLEHKGRVTFFGDSTGLNKSAAGPSLWAIVDDLIGKALNARGIQYSRNVPPNPMVPLRVRALNAKMCSAAGIRSYWIDPRNERTITDYLMVVWDKTKPDVQKYGERGGSQGHLLTHLSDTVSYLASALFPMGREVSEIPAIPNINFERFRGPRMN